MDIHERKIRPCYDKVMSDEDRLQVLEDLGQEDRYDMSNEMAMCRWQIASLVRMRHMAKLNHGDKPEVLVTVEGMLNEAIQHLAKTAKLMREVEHAGQTFSPAEVSMLVEKICSVLMFHITDLSQREAAVEDILTMCSDFVAPQAKGTLITPDQDANLMDATVPLLADDEPHILTIDGPPPEDM